jgi:putative transposase
MGNLLAVRVHAANIHDTKGGVIPFHMAQRQYPTIKAVCADAGYLGTFVHTLDRHYGIPVDISKRIKPAFEVLPKRWRVERTLAWLISSRRLAKDYEIRCSSAEAMVIIAHLHMLLRRF